MSLPKCQFWQYDRTLEEGGTNSREAPPVVGNNSVPLEDAGGIVPLSRDSVVPDEHIPLTDSAHHALWGAMRVGIDCQVHGASPQRCIG